MQGTDNEVKCVKCSLALADLFGARLEDITLSL
jgi:hypothetical protein